MDVSKSNPAQRTLNAILYGVVFGLFSLLISIVDWLKAGRWESRHDVLFRAAAFVFAATLVRFLTWDSLKPLRIAPRSPAQTKVITALFWAITLGLIFVLWKLV